ncbi:hypothetical protein F5887DRAFT_213800 [Amanita rubescens]|nr:hypothetical protein F5887DRAFT_213800 [Amanita rubescens]
MCRPLPSSFEQPCPMCRVFPHPRCPHNLETCRNRKNHPAFDVQYLTNAEVDWFNGCGFCKLSRTDPNAKSNQGWPGCCRPPIQTEFASIPIYVWRAVNIVHHVQAACAGLGRQHRSAREARRAEPPRCQGSHARAAVRICLPHPCHAAQAEPPIQRPMALRAARSFPILTFRGVR